MKIELEEGKTVSEWIPAEWIPGSEDLPDDRRAPQDGEEVLVTVQTLCGFDNIRTSIEIAKYSAWGGKYKVLSGKDEDEELTVNPLFGYKRVTAWAHLPEPYNGAE